MIDKNKLKEKIQKTPSKDLLYLTVKEVDSKTLRLVFSEIEKFVNRNGGFILVSKN